MLMRSSPVSRLSKRDLPLIQLRECELLVRVRWHGHHAPALCGLVEAWDWADMIRKAVLCGTVEGCSYGGLSRSFQVPTHDDQYFRDNRNHVEIEDGVARALRMRALGSRSDGSAPMTGLTAPSAIMPTSPRWNVRSAH